MSLAVWLLLRAWLGAAVLVVVWCAACIIEDRRQRRANAQPEGERHQTGVDVSFEPVGVCSQCEGPVLTLVGQAVASCPCGACDIPSEFLNPSVVPITAALARRRRLLT